MELPWRSQLRTVPEFAADAALECGRTMSSCTGNRNMLSSAPHYTNYCMLLTASQQKSDRRESPRPVRFHNTRVTESSLRVGADAVSIGAGKEPR